MLDLSEAIVRRLPPRSEARIEWEDHLRPLIRLGLRFGDVVFGGAAYDVPISHSGRGIDTVRRMAYVDVVQALNRLETEDPFGRELVRRSIGVHCGGCAIPGDHWHTQSWHDLTERHERKRLEERFEGALSFVVAYCR